MAQPECAAGSDVAGTWAPLTRSGLVPQAGGTKGSTARRVAFRIVAILASLWALVVMVFGLTEVVFMGLPSDTLLSVPGTLDDGEFDLAHRAHLMSVGIVAWSWACSSSFANPCCSRGRALGGEELDPATSSQSGGLVRDVTHLSVGRGWDVRLSRDFPAGSGGCTHDGGKGLPTRWG